MKNLSRNDDKNDDSTPRVATDLSRDVGDKPMDTQDDDKEDQEEQVDKEEQADMEVDQEDLPQGGDEANEEVQVEETLGVADYKPVFPPGMGNAQYTHCVESGQPVRRPPHRFEDIRFKHLDEMQGEDERPERLEQKWHGGYHPGGPAECIGKGRCILTKEEQRAIDQWNPATWIGRANNLPKNEEGEISTEAFLTGAAMVATGVKRGHSCYCQNFCSACTTRLPMAPEEGKEMQGGRRISQGQAPGVKNEKAWKSEVSDGEIVREGVFRFQFYAAPKAVGTAWVTGTGKNNANRQNHSKAFWAKHTRASAYGIKKVHDRQRSLATERNWLRKFCRMKAAGGSTQMAEQGINEFEIKLNAHFVNSDEKNKQNNGQRHHLGKTRGDLPLSDIAHSSNFTKAKAREEIRAKAKEKARGVKGGAKGAKGVKGGKKGK